MFYLFIVNQQCHKSIVFRAGRVHGSDVLRMLGIFPLWNDSPFEMRMSNSSRTVDNVLLCTICVCRIPQTY
jgi:hypothetical protein